jgi:hypothetical protein
MATLFYLENQEKPKVTHGLLQIHWGGCIPRKEPYISLLKMTFIASITLAKYECE